MWGEEMPDYVIAGHWLLFYKIYMRMTMSMCLYLYLHPHLYIILGTVKSYSFPSLPSSELCKVSFQELLGRRGEG